MSAHRAHMYHCWLAHEGLSFLERVEEDLRRRRQPSSVYAAELGHDSRSGIVESLSRMRDARLSAPGLEW